jgi:hypothetical protein
MFIGYFDVFNGSDSEKLATSTMGPLCPEQQTRGMTLDEFCLGPLPDIAVVECWAKGGGSVLHSGNFFLDHWGARIKPEAPNRGP